MGRHTIFKEFVYLVTVVIGVSVLTFMLGRLAPGDPVESVLHSENAIVTQEDYDRAYQRLGLDKSYPEQYAIWANDVLHGDFGISYHTGQPVLTEITSRMPVTITLTLSSLMLMLCFSIPLAWLSSSHQGGIADNIVRIIDVVFMALPSFCVGILVLLIFGVQLKWLPVASSSGAQRFIMPTLTLALTMSASMTRFLRTQFLEQEGREYVLYARAMGVPEAKVVFHSIFRNMGVPFATNLGLRIGGLLGGSYIIEALFVLQGAGNLLVSSITLRDYPVIQAYALMMAVIYVGIRIIVDIASSAIDPRIRKGLVSIR